jgi:malonate transporter
MWEVFLQTLPFFLLIGLGFTVGKVGFFTAEATAYLTKFVFYFALSALLFRFTSQIAVSDLFDGPAMSAYLLASLTHYSIMVAVALFRGHALEEAGFEGHAAVHGNIGFIGIPMLGALLGPEAVAVIVLLIFVDMIVFGTLVVVLVSLGREGRITLVSLRAVLRGLVSNPMILSIVCGVAWSSTALSMPEPIGRFFDILGAAATPGALFAIGCSLAYKRVEEPATAVWLSVGKLVIHPFFVFLAAYLVFPVDPFTASVMVAAASLPVAGNIYILAQHYSVLPERISAAILLSTAAAIFTVPIVLSLAVP